MSITCNTGFRASGTKSLNCVNGKWDSPVPQCIGKITVKSTEAVILTVITINMIRFIRIISFIGSCQSLLYDQTRCRFERQLGLPVNYFK